MKRFTTQWADAWDASYNPPSEGTFGDELIGDFGFRRIDNENKEVVFAFRGSDDKEDWISNANQKVNEYGYHSGFYAGAMQFAEQYSSMPQGYKIKVVGYSRGGGLGLMAAVQILKENPFLAGAIDVTTFGCPKVTIEGSYLWDSVMSGDITHVTVENRLDPVPHIPNRLTRFITGEFSPDSRYEKCATEAVGLGREMTFWEKARLANYVRKAVRSGNSDELKRKYGRDHHSDNYVIAMEREGLI